MSGRSGKSALMTLSRDDRAWHLVWLLCAGSVALLGFWYPEIVANQNPSTDDRFGFVLLIGVPFELVGGITALRAILGLIAVTRRRLAGPNQLWLVAGIALTMLSLSPLLIIGSRFMR